MKRVTHIPFTLAVVLSGGGSPAAFDVLRSLALGGIRTVVASSQRNEIALFSKECVENVPLPALEPANDEETLKALIGFAQWCVNPPVLFYASGKELSFVIRTRDRLSKYFRFLLPPPDLLECLSDDVQFDKFAKMARIPVPDSVALDAMEQLADVLPSIDFPCVVKPAGGANAPRPMTTIRIASNADELWRLCSALPEPEAGFLVQSYIDGSEEGLLSFHGYFDERSRCLCSFIEQQIRTFPPQRGRGTYMQTKHHPMLLKLSILYLQRLKAVGMASINYKWDPHSEQFKVLEITPGCGMWNVLGSYAGVNLVHTAYQHLSGKEILPQTSYENGVRLVDVRADVRSLVHTALSRKGRNIFEYVLSLRDKKYFRVFDPQDIFPFVVSLLNFLTGTIHDIVSSFLWHKGEGRPAVVRTEDKSASRVERSFEPSLDSKKEIAV
ncbi:MAG TPA: hypothetical protein VMM58_06680 [Bacteroidota bacterium]|nr:hypothetical protein [Bacteroidota bacterium]